MKQIKEKEHWINQFSKTAAVVEELEVLYEFYQMDECTLEELEEQHQLAIQSLDELELNSTLDKPEDSMSCMLKINAGAGGTESCDWAAMLLRMYRMWSDSKGYKVTELDFLEGDVAGIKTATIEIDGAFTYGMLKGENGVHRLVRPSPSMHRENDKRLLYLFLYSLW